jgi:hypothetical protein
MQALLAKAEINEEERQKFLTLFLTQLDTSIPSINQEDIKNVIAYFEHKDSCKLENCFKKIEEGTFKSRLGKTVNKLEKCEKEYELSKTKYKES